MKIKIPENYDITIRDGYIQLAGKIKQDKNGVIKVKRLVYSDTYPSKKIK